MSDPQSNVSSAAQQLLGKDRRLAVLVAAAAQAEKAYREEPTAKRLEDWTSALRALEAEEPPKAADREPEPPPKVETFPTLETACAYLAEKGFKCRKSKLSEDVLAGKIGKTKDGKFSKEALDAYVVHCRPLSPVATRDERLADYQEEKERWEAECRKEKAKRLGYENQIREGKLINAADAFRLAAQLVTQLRADMENLIQGQSAEMVHLANGQDDRIPDVIEFLQTQKANMLNRLFRAWRDGHSLLVPRMAVEQTVRDFDGQKSPV